MKKILIIIAAALVLVPLGKWWFSPEQVVVRKTKHLMEVLTIAKDTSVPFRQAKVFSMNSLLQPEVTISSPKIPNASGRFDKQEIESGFSWVCKNAKESDFIVTEVKEVKVNDDEAVVRVFVEGFLELPSYRPADGKFEVTITWKNTEDGWRFEKVIWISI